MSGQSPSVPDFQFALVTYNAHGSYSGCVVQRSGWTTDVDNFLQWLSAIRFSGGGFNDAAIAEGLAEALVMFSLAPNGSQTQQDVDGIKHCILVAASNPHPLPTPVYRPLQRLNQGENIEAQTISHLSDAEAVATSFPQMLVSLSVICSRQLPKLRAIYKAGKRNLSAVDPPVDYAKNPQHLVLISENFMEARTALSRPGITSLLSSQSPVILLDINSVPLAPGPSPTTIPSGSQMVQSGIGTNQEMISGLDRHTSISSGTFIPTPGMAQPGMPAYNMHAWGGNLAVQNLSGQPVIVASLQAYKTALAPEILGKHWPSTIQIDRMIPLDQKINKNFLEMVDVLEFQATDQHAYLGRMKENKLCAVIKLESQVLVLSVINDDCSLLKGVVFPGDMDGHL